MGAEANTDINDIIIVKSSDFQGHLLLQHIPKLSNAWNVVVSLLLRGSRWTVNVTERKEYVFSVREIWFDSS